MRLIDPLVLLGLIEAEPSKWLWAPTSEHEIFGVLPGLWKDLDEAGRTRLLDLILAGPPPQMFRAEIEGSERLRVSQRMKWQRLSRLKAEGVDLLEKGAQELAELDRAHPDWRSSTSEVDDFPVWSSGVTYGADTDYTCQQLLALPDEEIATVLQTHTHNREGLMDALREAGASEPKRAINILTLLAERADPSQDIFTYGLSGLIEFPHDHALKTDVIALLERLVRVGAAGPSLEIARVFRRTTEQLPAELEPRALKLFDELSPLLVSQSAIVSNQDRMLVAINHVRGVLVEALLEIVSARQPTRGAGLGEQVRTRLALVIASKDDGATYGRVIVGSRLWFLYVVDPDWTRVHVIPLLDWAIPDEATSAWQGYLASPRIAPNLFADIKAQFLLTFDHVTLLQELQARHLADLVPVIAVEFPESMLTADEARDCLRKLGDSGRAQVAWWLRWRLKGAADRAANLWRERIGPWIKAAWPREQLYVGGTAAARLAWMATYTGESFGDAVGVIEPLLGEVEEARDELERMREEGFFERFPVPSLALVAAITGPAPPIWFGDLGDALRRIASAWPGAEADPRFLRLREVAARRNI